MSVEMRSQFPYEAEATALSQEWRGQGLIARDALSREAIYRLEELIAVALSQAAAEAYEGAIWLLEQEKEPISQRRRDYLLRKLREARREALEGDDLA